MPNYAIEIKKDELNPLIIVKNKNECIAEILFKGATINALYFNKRNLLFGYDLSKTIDFSDCRSSFLFPFPNRIRDGKYLFEGKEYHFPINEPARNNAIHGFLKEQIFNLADSKSSDDSVEIKLNYQYLGDRDYYPFPFLVEIIYLFNESNVAVNFNVTNIGLSRMPIGFGWHPYFQSIERVDDMEIKLPVVEQIELDHRSLPTGLKHKLVHFEQTSSIGNREFDSLFKLKQKKTRVSWCFPTDNLCMEMDYNDAINHLQLYIPDNRQSIAIEPMTCAIDAFNTGHGLVVLSPEEKFEVNIDLKWNH